MVDNNPSSRPQSILKTSSSDRATRTGKSSSIVVFDEVAVNLETGERVFPSLRTREEFKEVSHPNFE